MENSERVRGVIFRAIEATNRQLTPERRIEPRPDFPVYGKKGLLDSLELVTLIFEIENLLAEELGTPVAVADDRAMAGASSPFQTVASICSHVETLVRRAAPAASTMQAAVAGPRRPLRVALLASATIDLLRAPLEKALEERGYDASFWTGGFGQYAQAILDPSSALYGFDPQVVILNLDGEDLFGNLVQDPFGPEDRMREAAESACAEVRTLVKVLGERLPQAAVVLNPAAAPARNALLGLEYNSGFSLAAVFDTYNSGLRELVREQANAVVLDTVALAAAMGHDQWNNPAGWYLARCRWSKRALERLAQGYAAVIAGRLGHIRKCIVVDLDNTLWGGVIGEDGMEGIRLGEDGTGRAFADFQSELWNLNRKGVLLAICSKNNREDALEAIRRHQGMRLREEHFAAARINWTDKASNLKSLAEELNLGLDSLVFLDDNPVEREWVRQNVPEVLTPDWPADPAEYRNALLELGFRHFCKLSLTEEDRRRGEMYQKQAERRKLETGAGSLEEFYRGLAMRAAIGLADRLTIPRVAQLTQKTNQFNLTTRRYTEAEIAGMAASGSHLVFQMSLDDRFGANGIVGVLILRESAAAEWTIDTFLLSCRVMGRTAEHALLATACDTIRARGGRVLLGEYLPTAKNAPVRDLYASLGFESCPEGEAGRWWRLDLTGGLPKVPEWIAVRFEEEASVGHA